MSISIDSRTVALWLFDEHHDPVLPSDATGNLEDLEPDSTLTRPAVEPPLQDVLDGTVPPVNGFGRKFTAAPATGLEVADTNDDLLLTGSMSIVALVALDVAGQVTAATPGTVVWRGRDTEETSFALRLTVEDAGNSHVRLQLLWEDESGVLVVDQGVLIEWADGAEYLIAAIRELDGDGYVCRYVVNGQAVDGNSGHDLSIGGTAGATVFVGAEPSGASSYVNHLVGTISYIEILGEAIAVEEVLQVWQLFAVDAPNSVVALKALLPPGPYDKADPNTSTVHGELDIEAAVFARVRNLARLRREYSLPGKAFGDALADWEELTGRPRYPDDSIDDRQARSESYLQGIYGYNTADIRAQLAELLGYEDDPTQADILKYTVDHTQDFSTAVSPGAPEATISQGNGAMTVVGAKLRMDLTAADGQFSGSLDDAMVHLWSFSSSLDVFFGGQVDRTTLPANVISGFLIGSRQTNQWLLVGLRFDGVDYRVAYNTFNIEAAGAWGTEVDIVDPANDDPTFFRFRHRGDGVYDVQTGATDVAAQAATPVQISGGPNDPLWAGFAMISFAASVSAQSDFDDWYSHEVEGVAPTSWYVYRDPADPGEYDVEGATKRLREIGPTHFEAAAAIDQVKVVYDDTTNGTGYDREPMEL